MSDFFSQFNFNSNNGPSLTSILKNVPLTTTTLDRMRATYSFMAQMMLVSAVACYINVTRGYLEFLTGGWSLLGGLGSMLAFAMTPATRDNEQQRRGYLYLFSLFKGLSLVPLIQWSLYVDPSNIYVALSAVAVLFVCFTGAVVYSPDRRPAAIYTAALISSLSGMAFWLSLTNLFLYSSTLFSIELYVGLALFSLYVVFDTQVLIARAESGDKDYLSDAMNLYVDLVALFVRIMIILARKDEERDRKKKRNNR